MTDEELISHLRKAGSTWFRNSDLLLLEELIHRWKNRPEHAVDSNVPQEETSDGNK